MAFYLAKRRLPYFALFQGIFYLVGLFTFAGDDTRYIITFYVFSQHIITNWQQLTDDHVLLFHL